LKARHRYERRALVPRLRALCLDALGLAALGLAAPHTACAQDLAQGIAAWAEATVGKSSVRWVGQRVLFPEPTARPASTGTLVSQLWPLRVHLTNAPSAVRMSQGRQVLAHAEQAYALLEASGLFALRGDVSPGHSIWRDLYLVEGERSRAALDDTQVVSDLDAGAAFALFDPRTPRELGDACLSEVLVTAELLELDPAESPSLRGASARYVSELITGETCADAPGSTSLTHSEQGVLQDVDKLAGWLSALGARQDQNRGLFIHSMWHFARQKTWEGSGLRGSPDLFEAIAKALEFQHEKLEQIGGEIANASALRAFSGELSSERARVRFSALPAHLVASPALGVLDSHLQLIDLEGARPGAQLTIWSRGEFGVRWALSATRLDERGRSLATVNAPVHKNPDTELTLELDAATRFVLASVTNMGSGLPDADVVPAPALARSARLIVAVPGQPPLARPGARFDSAR
jgi:hypothetical protein